MVDGAPGSSGGKGGQSRGQAWAVTVVWAAGASTHALAELSMTRVGGIVGSGNQRDKGLPRTHIWWEGSGTRWRVSPRRTSGLTGSDCVLAAFCKEKRPTAVHHLCSCGSASLGETEWTHARLELREMRGMLSGGVEAVLFVLIVFSTLPVWFMLYSRYPEYCLTCSKCSIDECWVTD